MKLGLIVLQEMNKQLQRIEACLDLLSDEQIWSRLKPNMNSIGNLCMHLAGNEYQHFVSGIGKAAFERMRSEEFSTDQGMSGKELKQRLQDVRRQSTSILEAITESNLKSSVTIHYSVGDWNKMLVRPAYESESFYTRELETILVQVCEHYSYHTGQIVLITKLLLDRKDHLTNTYH
jgi:uncharacterized damage-inducible protein DinB